MSNELDKVVENIRNGFVEELKNYTDFIKPLADEVHGKMYESDFRKYILPVIDGRVKADDTNMSILIHNVLQITNSPYVPIDVIDDNTEEVLFTFPPLMADYKENRVVNELFNYSKLIADYRALSSTRPGDAEAILKDTLPNLANFIKSNDEEILKMKEEIIKMYNYYNLPNPFKELEDEMNKNNNQGTDEEDEELFDYD